MIHRHRSAAMGTHLDIVVAAADAPLVTGAVARVAQLERRWSRFDPQSEISQLNARPGVPVVVSTETVELVQTAIDAWAATDGRFDPTVHDALCRLGYDRTFTELRPQPVPPPVAAPGPAAIEVDAATATVVIPAGLRLDLGGLAKGMAADLVSAELITAGATGASVGLGGDVRMRGTSPQGGGWNVSGAAAEFPAIDDGGVATSSIGRRRWRDATGAEHHHIVDPRTGRPVDGALHTVTVVAGSARQAEVLTKAAMVAGGGAATLLATYGVSAVLTDARGRNEPIGAALAAVG